MGTSAGKIAGLVATLAGVVVIVGYTINLFFFQKDDPSGTKEEVVKLPTYEKYDEDDRWEQKEDNATDYKPDYFTSTEVTKDNYGGSKRRKRSYKKSRKCNSKKNRRSKKRGKK
jgi:hypothetical protein